MSKYFILEIWYFENLHKFDTPIGRIINFMMDMDHSVRSCLLVLHSYLSKPSILRSVSWSQWVHFLVYWCVLYVFIGVDTICRSYGFTGGSASGWYRVRVWRWSDHDCSPSWHRHWSSWAHTPPAPARDQHCLDMGGQPETTQPVHQCLYQEKISRTWLLQS